MKSHEKKQNLKKKKESPKVLVAAKTKEDSYMEYIDAYENKCQLKAVRKKMVEYYKEHGPTKTAKKFECHINTVYKWVNKHKNGEELTDSSKAPKNIPHKIVDQKKIDFICFLRDITGYGSERLEKQFNLSISNMAIHRILKENDKINPPKKKKSTKRKNLWHTKKNIGNKATARRKSTARYSKIC